MSHKQANHCDNKRVPAGFRIRLLHTTVQLVTVMHVQAGLPTAIKTWKKRKICIHCPCILQCISVFGFVVSICSVFACFVCFCSEKSVFGHPLVKVTETCCVHFDNRVGFTSGATLSGETLIWANSENLSQDALKIVLILALTSLKRVSNWCTLSVSPSCLTMREDRSTGSLQPNGSFTPKSMKSSFRLRVIFLEPHHHLTSPHNSKGVSPTLQQLFIHLLAVCLDLPVRANSKLTGCLMLSHKSTLPHPHPKLSSDRWQWRTSVQRHLGTSHASSSISICVLYLSPPWQFYAY